VKNAYGTRVSLWEKGGQQISLKFSLEHLNVQSHRVKMRRHF